ncbi:MAG: response regulator [Bacteroidota bacterium]
MPAALTLPNLPARAPLVLVVDDDAQMRAYIRRSLIALPVRVEEATDGLDALAHICGDGAGAGPVVLVVTDVVMPRLDGWALKAALHADARWADLPVLLITGETIRARDGPVLRKPFNARSLRAAVQALLAS